MNGIMFVIPYFRVVGILFKHTIFHLFVPIIFIYLYLLFSVVTLPRFLIISRYNPKNDSWSTVAPLSVPRDAVAVCPLGDKLYVVGGYDGHTYLNTVESYDAQKNEWKQVIYKNVHISIFHLLIKDFKMYSWNKFPFLPKT